MSFVCCTKYPVNPNITLTPSTEDMETSSVAQLFALEGLTDDAVTSLLQLIGAKQQDSCSILIAIRAKEFDAKLEEWMVLSGEEERAAPLVEKSKARLALTKVPVRELLTTEWQSPTWQSRFGEPPRCQQRPGTPPLTNGRDPFAG